MLSNKRLLLGIVALLLIIRFVFVPWSEHHELQSAELSVVTKQLLRVKTAEYNAGPLADQVGMLANMQQSTKNSLIRGQSVSAISLDVQKNWQQQAQQYNVEMELFDWQSQILVSGDDIFQGRLMLRLNGKMASIAGLITQLEQNNGFNISTLRFSMPRARNKTAAVSVTLDVQLVYVLDTAS